jgi:hypothetical protein
MDIAVSVKDSFEIRPGMVGTGHAPGAVVIFDGRQCSFRLPPVGAVVTLLRPDGSAISASVTEQKEHGDGRSFFFGNLRKQDVPVGTIISWERVTADDESAARPAAVA